MDLTCSPLAIALLAALAGCAADAIPAPAAGRFRALTYNVAGLPRGVSKSHPDLLIPRISPLLNAYDLVLVQEDFAYHEDLVAEARFPYRSVPLAPRAGVATDGLDRLSRFPFGPLARVRWVRRNGVLSHGGDELARKGFSVAATRLAEGVVVDVYNVHGEAGHGAADDRAKAAGYKQLAAYINRRSRGVAVIVGGDTNLHSPRDDAILQPFLQATGLHEVSRELGGDRDRIDRFFYRSTPGLRITPQRWQVAAEFVDDRGRPLSDHQAVTVTFAWSVVR